MECELTGINSVNEMEKERLWLHSRCHREPCCTATRFPTLGLCCEGHTANPIVGFIQSYYLVVWSSCSHQTHKRKPPCLNLKINIKLNNLWVCNNCLCSFSWQPLPYLTLFPELSASKTGGGGRGAKAKKLWHNRAINNLKLWDQTTMLNFSPSLKAGRRQNWPSRRKGTITLFFPLSLQEKCQRGEKDEVIWF